MTATTLPSADWTGDLTADDADEARALSDLVGGDEARFVLASAVCNDLAVQRSVIADVVRSCPGVVTVEVTAAGPDPFAVADRAAAARPVAVFVTGLTPWLSDDKTRLRRASLLNATRERWVGRLPCPVVLWVNQATAQWLALHAPDLWRYRSHRFEFAGVTTVADPPVFGTMSPTDVGWGTLSADVRRRRMDELTARLNDNPSPGSDVVSRLVAKWFHELANHYDYFGELGAAQERLRRELEIGERLADETVISSAIGSLGRIQAMLGNLDVGEEMLRRALEIDRRLGRLEASNAALANLGNVARARGDLTEADALFREAAAEAERAGDLAGRASALNNLAADAMWRGDTMAAGPLLEQALDLYRRAGRSDGESTALSNLGALALRGGDLDRAQRLHEQGLALDRTTGRLNGEVNHLTALGFVNESRGDASAARDWWTQALQKVARYGVPEWSAHLQRLIDRLPPLDDATAAGCPGDHHR